MRDQAFAALGDHDLADGVVDGSAPVTTVTGIEPVADPDDETARVVRGTVTVPNFLSIPSEATVEVPEIGDVPAPGARLVYASPMPGTGDRPIVNPSAPTRTVPYVCSVPRSALSGEPAKPVLYRSEEHTSELQSLMRSSYAVCCLKKKTKSI